MKKYLLIACVCSLNAVSCASTDQENTKDKSLTVSKEQTKEKGAISKEAADAKKADEKDLKATADESKKAKIAAADAKYKIPATVKTPEGKTAETAPALAEIKKEQMVTTASAPMPASKSIVMYPTTSYLNVRSGPGVSHGVARVAAFGEAIQFSGKKKGSWMETTKNTWIYSQYLSSTKTQSPNDPKAQKSEVESGPLPQEKLPTPTAHQGA